MLIAAVFLSTVSKVPLSIREELVALNLLATIAYAAGVFLHGDLVAIISSSLVWLTCSSLVAYATVPSFDLSFAFVVDRLSTGAVHCVRLARARF